jgi:subtilisin family serine protease
MRKLLGVSALVFLTTPLAGAVSQPIAPEEAPRADASVLQALNRGELELRILVGVRDDTPSTKLLAAHPDPKGEPERRTRRLAAQKALAQALPHVMEVRRHYEGFSVMAARATREGVLALANRRDVSWVTIDGVRKMHAAPQPAQVLIHSDQVNSLGFTGAGQAVAVLDTGVDYSVPELGGGTFPTAKIVGGKDFGDDDDDPMDCEGHGTSVAAVAAGPTGVAPDAKIVAVKVVKTGKCDEADDSNILAGIDWAITNQATYHIAAINLSFGGPSNLGYCDDSYPEYVTAIDAANAAGIVFVASAGNDGSTIGIAAPACLSAAVSVGAVYPDSHSSVTWAGDPQCTDAPANPDTIVCFSNSASALSLLAPGAFWLVVTKGSTQQNPKIEYFHGTSASAPAVSGAVALLRQARPELEPSAIASLMRTSGTPLTDARNGVLTPRLDTLAAVQLPSGQFAPFDGNAVAIPDSSGSATATCTVSGFTGVLASVQAVVDLEHNDPRQLLVTLASPDGTTVTLHDHSGVSFHPINAVYGKTVAPAQSFGAFQGKQANGVWTLTVSDTQAGTSGNIRNFAIQVVAGQPGGTIPSGAQTEVVPVVGHVQGTKFFLSDVRLFNPLPEEQTLSLFYVAQGLNGSHAVTATRTVLAGQVLALNDVVGSVFGYADSIGELTLLGPDTSFITTSRAYTQGTAGTFGLFVPAFRSAEGLGPGERATANGLVKSPQFHTNAGFTEVSGSPVSVKMDIFEGDGSLLASTTRDSGANASLLVTDIIGDRGLGATSNFRIDYTVVSGAGRVIPYATFIDDLTGDGVFEAASRAASSSDDIIIAQASHATGANSDFFKTNLHITNLGTATSVVTVSLIPRVLTGTPNPPRVYAIAPGATLEKLDVLASEFALGDPSAAGLRIHPSAAARLAVSTRTFVEKFAGTFGFSIPGLPASEGIGLADGKVTVIQLDQSATAQGYRSNFGFAEVGGAGVVVNAIARRGDDGSAIGSRAYALAPGQSFQVNVNDLVGSGTFSNIYLEFSVASGAGRVLCYGVSVDNTSGDAIYMPAQREP